MNETHIIADDRHRMEMMATLRRMFIWRREIRRMGMDITVCGEEVLAAGEVEYVLRTSVKISMDPVIILKVILR